MANCPVCGICLKHVQSRPCPNAERITEHLRDKAGFEISLQPEQKVCYSCYKSQLIILLEQELTSRQADLQLLLEEIKENSTGQPSTVQQARSMAMDYTAIYVGEILLQKRAILLPMVYDFFLEKLDELVASNGIPDVTEEQTRIKLVCFLTQFFLNHIHIHLLPSQRFYTAGAFVEPLTNTSWFVEGSQDPQPDPEYTCNAEETDTMLWLHASKTNCKTILILSPDTDVYMIGLPLNCMQDKNIIVQISTFNSREVKVLYMNRMRSALSSDPDLANITRISLSMILQTLFVVTGCDYISFFSGIGKATFLRSFFQHAEFITGATQYTKGSLADTELNDDTHKLGFLAFMRLIGVVYFKKYATAFELDTPESYFKSFISSTTDAEKQHKVWLEELRTSIWPRITYEDDILPTTEALWRHWLRSCWVITMWKQSDRNIMQVADITRCGWKINNGIVSIDWDSDSNLAAINEKVILLTKGCKYKKGCNSSRCSCRKNKTKLYRRM